MENVDSHIVEIEVPLISLARRLSKEAPANRRVKRGGRESKFARETPEIAKPERPGGDRECDCRSFELSSDLAENRGALYAHAIRHQDKHTSIVFANRTVFPVYGTPYPVFGRTVCTQK
jgi:hypothetical protein